MDKKAKIKEILSKYRKAGEISKEAKQLAREIVVPGANVYEICESIEEIFYKHGGKPAFPTNISINNEAAHYSAEILDNRVIPKNSMVKVDMGVHIDGYIVDTAITLHFDPKLDKLSQASKNALYAAIKEVRADVPVSQLGKAVEREITALGYKPVANLSGHQIKRYNLHAGISIPNVGPGMFEKDNAKLQNGQVYAIEPFASNGKGWIDNGKITNIFRFAREPKQKHDLYKLYRQYHRIAGVLPFSPRIFYDRETGEEGKKEVMTNIKKLLKTRIIIGYPVLQEKLGVMISQHEHTIRVTKHGYEVFTLEDEDRHLLEK